MRGNLEGRSDSLILVLELASRNHHENGMSDKKRTTVTTIETHEVWIIRRVVPEPADEAVTITPVDVAQPATTVSPSTELTNGSETSKEQS